MARTFEEADDRHMASASTSQRLEDGVTDMTSLMQELRIDHRKVSVARSRWPIGDKGKKAN